MEKIASYEMTKMTNTFKTKKYSAMSLHEAKIVKINDTINKSQKN